MNNGLWREVIQAIEAAIPEYDRVNEKISFGRAMRAREYAADRLKLKGGMIVLDAGIGPGTMSNVLLSRSSMLNVVGLDASTRLLESARERFTRLGKGKVQLIRGAFETLPLRDGSFDRIVSAYAFRDSRNKTVAIQEVHRVIKDKGTFAIVDLGKPDSRLKRALVTTYVGYLMPAVARLSMSNAIHGNPWRMIFPTYKLLEKNSKLVASLASRFAEVAIKETSLGGLVIVFARKA